MRFRIAVAAVVAAGAIAAAGCSKSIADEVARDRQLDTDMETVTDSGVPGVALVIRDGSDTTPLVAGVADVDARTALGVDDRFRIGSVSKSYVAAVVLQLDAEHALSLEDSVGRWLPGLVPNGDQITVRELLNHTSGIPNYEEHPDYMAPYMAGDFAHVTPPQQLVAMGTSQGELFPPGASSVYSNTNYTLAGLLIEEVTGAPLATQLDQRIFEPLKLQNTYLPDAPEIDGAHAHGYFVLGQPPATDVTYFSPSIGFAGGSIISTPSEVNTFYRALLGGKLLPSEQLQEMMTTVMGDNGQPYGLGLASEQLSCGVAWGHQGNFPGYLVLSYSSADGQHQATGAFNLDPNSMGPESQEAVGQLMDHAFCGVKP